MSKRLANQKSIHLVTTSSGNVQWGVPVVVDYVCVCTRSQHHCQGVLDRFDWFFLIVTYCHLLLLIVTYCYFAVAGDCCMDRRVPLAIWDISCRALV